MKNITVEAFKAMDKNMKCRDFQYEIWEEYSEEKEIDLCSNGFHACEFPLDVFNYYDFKSRFFKVSMSGEFKRGDDKSVSSKIKIESEINLKQLFEFSFKKVIEICSKSSKKNTSGYKAHANTSGYEAHANTSGNYAHANTSGNEAHANTSGNYAHANTSGNKAHANTSGYEAHANTSGNYAHANTSGNEAISCSLGINSKVMVEGDSLWIVLTDWVFKDGKYKINKVVSAKVGDDISGTIIKSGHWYWFEEGIFNELKA